MIDPAAMSSFSALSSPAAPAAHLAELILGGQKSGKSRRAEETARDWLQGGAGRRAILLATAQSYDDEMALRITRHQVDRAARVPGLATQEVPLYLAQAVAELSTPQTLLVIDCLTMWLTNWTMPMDDAVPVALSEKNKKNQAETPDWSTQAALFLEVLAQAPGPVVLVGNEIGWGVIPMGREVRVFVDQLGILNQRVAACCGRVTLMCAGLPLTLKAPV